MTKTYAEFLCLFRAEEVDEGKLAIGYIRSPLERKQSRSSGTRSRSRKAQQREVPKIYGSWVVALQKRVPRSAFLETPEKNAKQKELGKGGEQQGARGGNKEQEADRDKATATSRQHKTDHHKSRAFRSFRVTISCQH